ncbi:PREDICTED: uncharacterized protein LOC105449787 [Wasmannia auropunctata]|uniref:uncharacterized protein LOC105449787 n=1 Tax=Wasmannia auropunctata TaxID=64793 RepID=UPI0005EF06CF|nr:PREDICTED: uncharacterized protein LOC105449787 [Wasmannia auropunctata]
MTAGTVTTGIGYAQLEELLAAANIPCMSERSYIKYRESLINDFEKTALKNMKMAGDVEKQIALARNETINGVPYITVVADGSWAKRSYGTTYDSLSGVGAIIGYRTKKVLFVGIRNKFCTISCDENSDEDLCDFQVVEFITRRRPGTRKIDLVPTKWIEYDIKKGKFMTKFMPPPYEKEDFKLITDLAKNLADAPDDWVTYGIKVRARAIR